MIVYRSGIIRDHTTPRGFLRVFRVLRPLRSLNRVPELRRLVNTILMSVPKLVNVGKAGEFRCWLL